MLLPRIIILVLPALVQAHSHHAHDQEAFSQDRLDELERKWGIDVSQDIGLHHLRTQLTAIVGLLWHLDIRASPAHTLLDPSADDV